ncbi:MAG: phosphoglycerate mutase (2,3-diphosphoglycerate-independent) [Parcubacteria group bacterium]|nr:phosphoglycerate mutase (2,3-diphosphoglycerate-independent) [Parcubacteria group bacterium]|tara:strand:- start:1173 stop:2750 length:1578 start_codon:yes stop_codon:yes gene_type:complete
MPKKETKKKKPLVLLILDGWGLAPKSPANAIALAKTPVFDKLWQSYPKTKLKASGKAVGLPPTQVGNSEAGHMNIGAGRIVDQDSVFISKDINTGKFFKNPAFEAAYEHTVNNKSDLHIMGMISNGQSAHSDPDHLLALLTWARLKKIKNVYLHLFTDGRDSPPHSALKSVEAIMRTLKNKESNGKRSGEWIATIMGRFYAMDRKKEWSRTKKAYEAMVLAKGITAKSPQAAITQSYNREETDEFIPPYVIKRGGKPIAKIKNGDAILFFNLRSDRARQLAKPFVQKNFNQQNPGSFRRSKILKDLVFTAMTDFGPDLGSILTAYPAEDLTGTLTIALKKYKQLYITEKEKHSHVTYFFNGGYADSIVGEDRIIYDSPKVRSYALTPKMSIVKVTTRVIKELPNYDFITVNLCNSDMIGHTGDIKACIAACEITDQSLGKIKNAVDKLGGTLLVTADHGNAEKMLDLETGEMYTEHTNNLVPFIVIEGDSKKRRLHQGKLADIAPTVLKLMKVKQPKEMTGKPLF